METVRSINTIDRYDILSLTFAAVKVGIMTALGAQVEGFPLPPLVVFTLVVVGAMLSVITTAMPSVGPFTQQVVTNEPPPPVH